MDSLLSTWPQGKRIGGLSTVVGSLHTVQIALKSWQSTLLQDRTDNNRVEAVCGIKRNFNLRMKPVNRQQGQIGWQTGSSVALEKKSGSFLAVARTVHALFRLGTAAAPMLKLVRVCDLKTFNRYETHQSSRPLSCEMLHIAHASWLNCMTASFLYSDFLTMTKQRAQKLQHTAVTGRPGRRTAR